MATRNGKLITSLDQLRALYGEPTDVSIAKEIDHVSDHYRAFIEAAPFFALATVGPEGLDCSPRGDVPGFVRIADPKTLLVPDRRGNNRIDSLRNIMRDPHVALLFLIPGIGETIRVIGRATLSIDPDLLASFTVNGKAPNCVIVVAVEHVFYQCTKAIVRSQLWDPARHVDRKTLPTAGTILAGLTAGRLGGAEHDKGHAERTLAKLY
jgi:PPOX class probable FMN-dependent enzyme